MVIYLKAKLKPQGRKDVTIRVRESNQFRKFTVGDVAVTFDPEIAEIIGFLTIDGDEKLLAYYQDAEKKLPRDPIFEKYRDHVYDTIRSVIKYLKYFYGIDELHEQFHLSGRFEWSLDQGTWLEVPEKHETRWLPGGLMYTLDDNFLSQSLG